MLTVKIIINETGNPPGKLADAELCFSASPDDTATESARSFAALDGLKLIGFAIWERRTGGRVVTFPARTYSVNGERHSFALLRPNTDPTAHDRLREFILAAYDAHQAANTPAPSPSAPAATELF